MVQNIQPTVNNQGKIRHGEEFVHWKRSNTTNIRPVTSRYEVKETHLNDTLKYKVCIFFTCITG